MLLNGRKITEEYPDKTIIQMLRSLPSGFPNAGYFPHDRIKFDQTSKAYQTGVRAKKAMRMASLSGEDLDVDYALEMLETALKAFEKEDQNQYGFFLYEAGRFSLAHDRRFLAVDYAQKSVDIFSKEQTISGLDIALPLLFETKLKLYEDAEDIGHQGLVDQYAQQLAELSQQARGSFMNMRKAELDHDAHLVEQAEVGFSDMQPIGTINVQDCICIMVRDPKSHKTALAHFDAKTDPKSLDVIFDHLPKLNAGEAYQVRLLGARYYQNAKDQQLGDLCERNLTSVISGLRAYPVEILTAQIADIDQAATVVVNPEDFSLKHAVPMKNIQRFELVSGHQKIQQNNHPLRVSFDLTKGDAAAPVKVTRKEILYYETKLKTQSMKNIADRYMHVYQRLNMQKMAQIQDHMVISDALAERQQKFDQIVARKLDKLAERGLYVAPEKRQEIFKAVRECPKHIGPNADCADAPLQNIIEKGGLFDIVQGRRVHVRVSYLHKYDVSDQPYQVLLEAKKAGTRKDRVQAVKRRFFPS